MSSLKPEMQALCKDVATEFENWSFVGDQFKNKTLKHTDLIVSPGLTFQGGGDNPSCSMQPAVYISHKKSMTLYKKLLGYEQLTSFIRFQTVRNLLQHYPENLRIQGYVFQHRQPYMVTGVGKQEPWPKECIGFDEARPAIKGLLMDGIELLRTYYDLSSEENMLCNLPPKYVPATGANEEMEMQPGLMICVTRILQGDFDFVERYASDDYKTLRPKREVELNKIVAALPDLKRKYAETGSVI